MLTAGYFTTLYLGNGDSGNGCGGIFENGGKRCRRRRWFGGYHGEWLGTVPAPAENARQQRGGGANSGVEKIGDDNVVA